MSGIPLQIFKRKGKKKPKPAPLTRRQSFNGDVKAPGQPPSPLIQQVCSRKKGQQDEPGAPLQAKSSSLSSLLGNNEDSTSTSSMVNGVTDFAGQRGHQELCASSSSMLLDRQRIIDIQKDIHLFTLATTELKETFNKAATGDDETCLTLQSVAMDRIENLNCVMNSILTNYPEVSSSCIKNSLATLTDSSKSRRQTTQGVVTWCKLCLDALETLIDAFTKSAHGYMSDSFPDAQQMSASNSNLTRSFTSPTASIKAHGNMMKSNFSKSAENLSSMYQYHEMQQDRELTADIDKALLCTENAVEIALDNFKTRIKYIREITTYMNKRAQIVADYERQIGKLTKSIREVLPDLATESGESLPLLTVFQQCLDEDVHFARMNNATFNIQVTQRLVEAMEKRNAECVKLKKKLKDTWAKEQKKLSECKAALKAAKSKYTMLGQELSRLKAIQMQKDEIGHKQEKRKKEITDMETKRAEAEIAYKQAVANANDCQYQVHMAQKSILCAFRRTIMESDQTLRDSFESHFELQHNFFCQFPQRFVALQDQVGDFEPGRDFYQHVIRQPQLKTEPIEFVFEEFDPDGDSQSVKGAASGSCTDLAEPDGLEFRASTDSGLQSGDTDSPMFSRRLGSPINAWESYQAPVHTTHSPQHSTASSNSITATPTISPGVSTETQLPSIPQQHQQQQQPVLSNSQPVVKVSKRFGAKRMSRPMSMANFFEHQHIETPPNPTGQRRVSADVHEVSSVKSSTPSMSDFNNAVMSKSARTHRFKKADDPNRCRECDNNVYFHGVECEVCGLTCHQKCLEFLMIKCGNKKLQRRIRTFGVDFRKHLEVTHCNIPIIVTKCINELDERGLNAKGIYRLSGAKSKMEKLCRLFEVGGDRVDISDQSPHQIASCLKLYFRQLPEPLLTHALYSDFINCAKEAGKILPVVEGDQVDDEVKEKERAIISNLYELLMQLNAQHYLTLARLLFHLNRVHQHNRWNSMPASNLGIVFGPNLLQPKEAQSSFVAIKEMTYQAKVVELLIHYAHEVLNITENKVKQEENAEDDIGTVEAYIPMEQCCSEYSYNSAVDDKMETRTTISDALDLDDDSSKLFGSDGSNMHMEELLHSLYHSARIRLGDDMPLLPKSKSVSPDNEDFENMSLLPGSVGSESESLLSLQTPRSCLAPVEERQSEFKNSNDWNDDNDHDAILHGVPNPTFPLNSMHSRSTPHLFVNNGDCHYKKARTSVPSIGIDTETESGFGSNRGMSEQSLNNDSEYEDTESDPEFDGDNDVLSLMDGDSSFTSPTNESTHSMPHRSATLSVQPRQRKSSSFKRDWPGRQAIAKRAVSLHIPRNKDGVVTKKPLCKSTSNYLSSSLSQLQHYEPSPSPVSLDRYTSGAGSSHSDRAYSSETNSPWSTPLHKMQHNQMSHLTHFHHDDMLAITDPDNEISDDVLVCSDDALATNSDTVVTNERLRSLSTSGSEDLLPYGEEKAAREQNTTENDKEIALETRIRREFKKVDSIGEKLCYLYQDCDSANPFSNRPSSSEDGMSVQEVRLDMHSLSPLSEISMEDVLCGKNMPYHSSSNSTSSAEIHFIHKQHGSTASEQSMDAQNKRVSQDQLALVSSHIDHVPPSPQRYRRLFAITPAIKKLTLSRSTSDVSSDVKHKEKHTSASPKGGGFKFSLKRKNSLVLPDGRENDATPLSLTRDKSKSTNEIYTAKEKGRTIGIFPRFRKTKSNGRSKQIEVITSSSHSTSPKSKRKKSRAPLYV